MNKIIFPLKLQMRGLTVADLQDALQLCLDRSAVLANDEAARREMSAALKSERVEQIYGNATGKLLSILQRERGLQPSGAVDEATANALNALLREWGLLDIASLPASYLVTGAVRREDALALQGLRVRAVHLADRAAIRLGEDTTDVEGRYTIRYELLPGAAAINLQVSVIGEDGKPLQSSKVIGNAKPLEIIDLAVPVASRPTEQQRIEGSIVLEHGLPTEKLKLRLYRHDFGGKVTSLGETDTLAGGRYAFSYEAGNLTASLEVRAVKGDGNEIPLTRPLNELSAEARVKLNLVAPASLQPLAAEYTRLTADLTPHVGQMTKLAEARENAERQDLTVLNRATGWDARLIALAAATERLSADADVKLPQEALYGLLRAGLPSDKLLLAQVEPDVVEMAMKKVRDAGIVDLTADQIGEVKQQFTIFANKARLAMPAPGSRSTYGELLKSSGLPQEAQDKFAPIYLKHRGDGANLWEEAGKAGLDGVQIGKLQLQGKLAFLAGNSEAMTTRLMNGGLKDPAELAAQDYHRADTWAADVFDQAGVPQDRRANLTDADRKKLEAVIPAAYAGEKAEARLEAYADDMARKVRLSYPTQVLGRLIETDDKFKLPTDHAATVTLLKGATAQGFRMGETPVASFLKSHAGVQGGMNDPEFQAAGQQMKVLQRVYQITPSNEAMPVLLQLGMTSAYDVMAYPEIQFVALFEAKYFELYKKPAPAGVAVMVSRKAKQVSSVTYNLFTIAKKLDSEPPVAGLSAPLQVRESVKNELIKHFPTLESLFGSMDYCECEHCRSVLSPAAYLVDLLQFVDTEPGVWGNFVAQWKAKHGGAEYQVSWNKKPDGTLRTDLERKPYDALIERRPDLPHIALTCENTHTALPYIDIVNEILEYYVAHGKLAKEAAHDTGEATTAELLAEPQNVIHEAYDTLRAVSYPLNLPFDLWTETVRQFCNYFEAPLHRVLEVLRPGDDLFAPAQAFDRAAIFTESLGLSPTEVAVFSNANPLANDQWHHIYGFPSVRAAIQNPTNAGDVTLSVSNADAEKLKAGLAYTFFDTSANAMSAESKLVASVGAANSAGAGRTTITLAGVWVAAPDAGDLMVCDVPAMLKSAKALSRRLGVTYKEITEIAQTGFVNPELVRLSLLYKLGVSVADARFYVAHKALLPQDPATLSTDDQKRRLEVGAFSQQLAELAATFKTPVADLEAAILAIPFNRVLVLADPDTGCNFDLTTLQYSDGTKADPIVFLRISLFVRLWRKLGWSIEETDRALQTFVPKSAPFEIAHLAKQPLKTALIYLAHLKALDEMVKVGKQSRLKLLALWSDIATTGKKPLYAQLFFTRSVLKSAPVFDHALGQYLADPNIKVKDHVLALQGALGLTADEIVRILVDAGESIGTAKLSLPNVSLLYRYGLLARALKLTVRELIALKQLSGLDPLKTLHADPLATLDQDHPFSQTVEFIKVAGEVKDSGLKIEDLDYLLRHRFDETGKYRLDTAGSMTLLKSLSEGIRAIRAEHAVPDDPGGLSDEVLRQKLGLVLPANVVATFTAMMNGTAQFTATKSSVATANKFLPVGFAGEPSIREVPYNATRQEQKLTYQGVLFDPEKAALKARLPKPAGANPHVPSPLLADLLDNVQQQAQSFFDLHLLKQAVGVQPAFGFLGAADFTLLFGPLELLKVILPTDTQLEKDTKLIENTEIPKRNEATVRNRRDRLAQAFLPFLQQRLIRQFIVETMTTQTGADPVLVESLLTEARLLGVASPKPLLNSFEATAERALTSTFFASVDATGAALATLSLADADTGSKDKDGNPLKPAGANSARLEGYLEAPTAGAYRFSIELDKQNAEAELRFPGRPEPVFLKGTAAADHAMLGDRPNDFLELKAGVPYRFVLDLKNLNGGEARLMVQGETLPKGPLSQLTLYPIAAIGAAERAALLLNKALQLVQSLGLSEREIRYILTHAADFGGVSLSELPTETVGNTQAEKTAAAQRFGRFRRLAAYARLKHDSAGGTDDLIGIFEANPPAAATDQKKRDTLEKRVYPLIAKVMRRDEATVKATAEALVRAPAVPAFASEKPLSRLWEVLQVIERFGVPASSLLAWTGIVSSATTADRRFEIARDLKEAIKARFEPETWQRVAQPIFDKLRQRQRDALVSHVMHQHGFDRLEQLYEYFLIDPGMEPVVQTSRIRLAISSLQLFIQRDLLNLEMKVHPSTINAKQWEWMKRYRVWEANRKIFLFPENWLEPEFRDDKTHLFAELEGALLQGDVSNDLVEDAFLNYLKKLDELARLDIVAMHIEDNPDPARRILHVFGRTYSQPHKYFYRRYANQMWTPWEPVSAEIEGDHLAPVVWRDRLYLFWVTLMEKAAQPNLAVTIDITKPITLPAVQKELEVQLHWSEYLQGNWSTRESGGVSTPLTGSIDDTFDPRSMFIHVTKEPYENGDERGVYIHLSDPIDQAFYLAGRNSIPEKSGYQSSPAMPYSYDGARANRYSGSGALSVEFKRRITTEDGQPPVDSLETPDILRLGDRYTLLPCNNNLTALGVSEEALQGAANLGAVKAAIESGLGEIASLMKPVFYQDNRHTLFVEPNVTERTIEEWQEWVTRTPQPEPGWHIPDRWREIVVIPDIPRKWPIPEPGDPWRLAIDRGSIINPVPDRDWLVNPGTAIKFGDVLVGPFGQPGIEIVAGLGAGAGQGPVNIHPGSVLADGSIVVLRDENTFSRSGLNATAGGLNVIGGPGFNSALEKNFNDMNRSGFGAGASGAGRVRR